jgi:hypothetical protein
MNNRPLFRKLAAVAVAACASLCLTARADWTLANGYLTNDTTGWKLQVTYGTYAGVSGYTITKTQTVGTGTVVDLRNEALPSGVEIVSITKITGVMELYLPDTIVHIAGSAFYNNSTIVKIEPFLPKGLKYIGNNAFYRATNLAGDLSIATESENFGWESANSYIFQRCYRISSLVLGAAVTTVPANAFTECSGITNIVFNGPVTSIGESAFYKNSALKRVSPFLPDTLSSIGSSAFYEDGKLLGPLTLGLSANLTYGTSRTFFRCYAISNVTFGVGMLQMPGDDWMDYSALTNIVFKGFPTGLDTAFNTIKEYAACITVPTDNADWNTYFTTKNLIPWDDLTATQKGYFTSRFPNAEHPYGMCKIGKNNRNEWFFFATVETEGVKSLEIESSPAGVGAASATPGLGEHGDVTASLPLTCAIDNTAVLGTDRYTLSGALLSSWDGSQWASNSFTSGSSVVFNPAEDGAYKLTWQYDLTDYALKVAMPTMDLGTVTTNGTPTAPGFFAAGSTVTLTATAASADAPFVRWFGDVPESQVSNATITVTMDSAKTLIPYFRHDWVYDSAKSTSTDGYWVIKTVNIGAADTPALSLQNGEGVAVVSTVGTRELDLRKPIVGGGSFVRIAYKAFRMISSVETLFLPETIVSIGNVAFQENIVIRRIEPLVPNAVTNIGNFAFYRATALRGKVTLGGGGKPLAFTDQTSWLFQRNYLLTELDIGKGIELLPPYLMDSCTAVRDVYFHAKPEYASTTFSFSNYQVRFFVPRSDPGWRAYVSSPATVTPWKDLTAAQRKNYTDKYGDEVLPKGLTVSSPANQWILFWSPPDVRPGTVLTLR